YTTPVCSRPERPPLPSLECLPCDGCCVASRPRNSAGMMAGNKTPAAPGDRHAHLARRRQRRRAHDGLQHAGPDAGADARVTLVRQLCPRHASCDDLPNMKAGLVRETYPVQATASEVLILASLKAKKWPPVGRSFTMLKIFAPVLLIGTLALTAAAKQATLLAPNKEKAPPKADVRGEVSRIVVSRGSV